MPELLAHLIDPEQAEHPRIRNVQLAVDLARHTASGWNNAAIPDDFTALENLLHLNRDSLIERLRLTDDEKAQLPEMPLMPPPADGLAPA